MRPSPSTLLASTAAVVSLLGVAGCGDGSTSTDSSSPSAASAGPEVKQIEVTVDGDDVSPSGDTVDVAVGQPIVFIVKADAPGEIHAHSDPAQTKEFQAGTTTVELDPIERPGQVEVEVENLGKTIVNLQVR